MSEGDLFSTISASATAGGALGTAVPGVGTVVGTVVGAAFGVAKATGLVDTLEKHLFGEKGTVVANKVIDAVSSVAGVNVAASKAATTVEGMTAEQKVNLEVSLRQIAAQEADSERKAMLGGMTLMTQDTDSARRMASTADWHSPLAWGPLFVSTIILVLYAAVTLGWAHPLTDASQKLMDTALTLVLGYWLGSSFGSRLKDFR